MVEPISSSDQTQLHVGVINDNKKKIPGSGALNEEGQNAPVIGLRQGCACAFKTPVEFI